MFVLGMPWAGPVLFSLDVVAVPVALIAVALMLGAGVGVRALWFRIRRKA